MTLFVPVNVSRIWAEPKTGVSCPVTETMKVLGWGVISVFVSEINCSKTDVFMILAAHPESFRAVIGSKCELSNVEIDKSIIGKE